MRTSSMGGAASGLPRCTPAAASASSGATAPAATVPAVVLMNSRRFMTLYSVFCILRSSDRCERVHGFAHLFFRVVEVRRDSNAGVRPVIDDDTGCDQRGGFALGVGQVDDDRPATFMVT